MGHKLAYTIGHLVGHQIIARVHAGNNIPISLKRAAHGACIAVRHAQVNYYLARRKGLGSHIEIKHMSVGIFNRTAYTRRAEIGPEAGQRELATFLYGREKTLLAM